MTNQKLLMFAVAGLLAPTVAEARGQMKTLEMFASPTQDLAETVGQGPTERLAQDDEAQPGNEMPTFAFFADGISGLYFSMNTELAGAPAPNNMQLAMVPFKLAVQPDKSVGIAIDTAYAPRFVTNNNGNETRNANHPNAFAVSGGNAICVSYNYQANNSNDTKRYLKCFNKAGVEIMGQTLLFAKNNDDASMAADADRINVYSQLGGVNMIGMWHGANGNGADDGWFGLHKVTLNDALNPTTATLENVFDASVCPREERSHGGFVYTPKDPNTGYVFWTEGNTQPQRDGTWIAAIDLTPGAYTGANQGGAILWKQQVEGRIEQNNVTTYSMRAMLAPILEPADATVAGTAGVAVGSLIAGDTFIWRSGDVQGNNNNNEKGGEYKRMKMSTMRLTRAGMTYSAPMADVADELAGLDGTHLVMAHGMFGTTDALKPGVAFLAGQHTGSGAQGRVRIAVLDGTSFKDGGQFGVAPYDRHLYPNYTGNNPGNQGRNYADMRMIANPFLDTANGVTDAYLMVVATTGKLDSTQPQIKLAAHLSVLPIAEAKTPATPDPVDPVDPNPEPTDPTPDDDVPPSDSIGGCSTSSSTGGLATFLIIGLAAFIRRRRS